METMPLVWYQTLRQTRFIPLAATGGNERSTKYTEGFPADGLPDSAASGRSVSTLPGPVRTKAAGRSEAAMNIAMREAAHALAASSRLTLSQAEEATRILGGEASEIVTIEAQIGCRPMELVYLIRATLDRERAAKLFVKAGDLEGLLIR